MFKYIRVSFLLVLSIWLSNSQAQSIEGKDKVCPGEIVTYTVENGQSCRPWTWQVTGGSKRTPGENTLTMEIEWDAEPVQFGFQGITIYALHGNCNVSQVRLGVEMHPETQEVQILGNNDVCVGDELVYSAATLPPGSINEVNYYEWSVGGGEMLSEPGLSTLEVEWTDGSQEAAGVSVRPYSNNTCPGDIVNYDVNVTPIPFDPGPIYGPTRVCAPATGLTYFIDPLETSGEYTWTITGGTITSGNATKTITVNWTTAGIGMLTVTPKCGPGLSSTLNVVVYHSFSGSSIVDHLTYDHHA